VAPSLIAQQSSDSVVPVALLASLDVLLMRAAAALLAGFHVLLEASAPRTGREFSPFER